MFVAAQRKGGMNTHAAHKDDNDGQMEDVKDMTGITMGGF